MFNEKYQAMLVFELFALIAQFKIHKILGKMQDNGICPEGILVDFSEKLPRIPPNTCRKKSDYGI